MKKLVKFEKNGCNPCSMVSDWLDRRNIEYEKVNAFDDPMRAAQAKVRSVPTLILMEDDVEIARTTGFKPDEIEKIVNQFQAKE